MQKGIGSEAQRGFYNIGLYTDVEKQSYSSYTVAFEDQNDAKNFSYLLELAFEDLPDAAVDVAPLSNKVKLITFCLLLLGNGNNNQFKDYGYCRISKK